MTVIHRLRFAVLMGIFTLSIPACGSNAGSPRDNGTTVVALHESTSFIDRGVRAVVFPHGVAFTMRMDPSLAPEIDHFIKCKVTLPPDDYESLLDAFDRHRFFDLPRAMKARVSDGSSVFVLYADATREHRVYSYESPNSDFAAVKKVFEDKTGESAATGERLSALEFLEGIAAEMEKLPQDSPSRKTAAMWLDLTVRAGPPSFKELIDWRRFTLPGDHAVLSRDIPLWNTP